MADDLFPHDPEVAESQKKLHNLRKGTGVDRTLDEILRDYPEDTATFLEEDARYEDDRTRVDVEAAPKSPTTISLFQHPEAHPFVLDLALLRRYGPEWMQWEMETLEQRILNDFRTKSLSDVNAEKLQAVKSLHMRDDFWKEWQVFIPITMALNGKIPDFGVMSAVTVPEAMIAVDVANKLRSGLEWSQEMKAFLPVLFKHDDIFVPVAPLDFVEVDAEGYMIDVGQIRARWDEVRRSRTAPPSTTVENEQLRRMLEAWSILEENRKQAQDQLPLIYNES